MNYSTSLTNQSLRRRTVQKTNFVQMHLQDSNIFLNTEEKLTDTDFGNLVNYENLHSIQLKTI